MTNTEVGPGDSNQKFVYFIHVPKTAGTYVTTFLSGQLAERFIREGHTVPRHALRPWTERFGPEHYTQVKKNDCITFSVVRNPFDLLVSMYLFGFPYWAPRTLAGRRQIVWPFSSFRDYVTKLCAWDDYPWICPEQRKSLFFQLFDNHGACIPDLVLRQEFLAEGLRALGARLGQSWNPPNMIVNANSRRDYRDFYDKGLVQLVRENFASDLQNFGYDFDWNDGRTVIDGCDMRRADAAEHDGRLLAPCRTENGTARLTGHLADQDFHRWEESVLEQFRGVELLGHVLRRFMRELRRPWR